MLQDTRFAVAFGLALRQVRKNHRLSQEMLGYRAGLHRTYVGDVERGRRNITLASARRLANALGISLSELVAIAEALLNSEQS